VCHGSVDDQGRFLQASGDTPRVFHKSPPDLIGRDVSKIAGDRLALRCALALRKVFAGEPLVEELRLGEPESTYFIAHLRLRGSDGQIVLAAGFAIDPLLCADSASGQRAWPRHPSAQTQNGPLHFLHDEVAQSLSAAGLQLDLLRMDLEARVPEIAARTAEIQNLLDDALRRVREFMAGTSR
jgi:hypothetical protein